MKLLIHVGTEKTGSSFLQKLCGKNRDFLQEKGIWFPSAGKYEKMLQQDTISPGNADELERYIRDLRWAEVSSWLSDRVEEAINRGCSKLLLSNELLVAALSTAGAINQFQDAAASAGIGESSSLLLIRDPTDQAISLYKHRAKSGAVGSVEKWLATGYFLPKHLSKFLAQIDQSDIELHLRKYVKESPAILSVFFHDWLKVETPPIQIEESVNPSLTLSELAVIRHISEIRPDDRSTFYSSFLGVPQSTKTLDSDIEKFAFMKVESFLTGFDDVWQALDKRLSVDGGLRIPRARDYDQKREVVYTFSDAQIRALSEAHSETFGVRYWLNTIVRARLRKLVRPMLSRLRGR